MADISKCYGTNCPMKESCYRFTATANEYRQSYFMEVPLKIIEGEISNSCDHYWDDKYER